MYDWNEAVRSLNVGLPDDIARLKAAGYYQEAIARIDRLLAEDWTKTQNGPASNGIAPPEGYVPPENPTPHGVDALREALTVQKEIMRRLPGEYCWTEAEAIARMQERVKDFTAEEFKKLDWEGRMDWRFVEGEKRYQARFAETLLATHADLAARKLTPDAPNNKNEERHRLHEKMEREGGASADITLRTSIRMSDEAFAAALEKAKAEGRDAVHVRAWLALPAACPSQSHITLDGFTETPGHIAAEDAPQRTVCWEADLTENRTFGAEYSYRETAVYADPLSFTPDPEQYDTNVATIPGSTQRVEYAIRMPGADGGSVWLPIDSKFPGDTYAHLQDAYASGDAQAVEDARHALELVLRSEARDIREKYVEPPYTTAFGILFLPFEGLYAEVVNAGLLEVLQRDYQVNVAGPSTMAALLNSLQMGFKTLAIQKRSGEVWQLLGAVKTEFDKFGQGLAKMQQRLRQTDEELDQLIGVRSRAISRKLRSVQSLDEASASALLEIDDMNELPKALSETSETSGKVGEY